MTTHTPPTRRPGRPVTTRAAGHYINRDHTVTGTPDQLANIVANHRNAGTLIAMTAPRPVGDHFQLIIRLREYRHTAPPLPTTGTHTRTRRTRIAVIVTTVTGTVAGLISVAAYLIGQLVELIAAHAGLIFGVLVLAAILAALAARSSGRRRHCPGC